MKRFSPAIVALSFFLLPLAASAASLDGAGIIRSVTSEIRPIQFSYTVTQPVQGGTLVASTNGATEGRSPDKMWAITDYEFHDGSDWVKMQTEMRLKQGKGYFLLRSFSASSRLSNAAVASHLGKWYDMTVSQPCNCWGLQTVPDADVLGALFTVSPTRFQTGMSYVLELKNGALPSLLQAFGFQGTAAAADVRFKVDTNTVGAFQFASFTIGSIIDGKAQRQFYPVYMETPRTEGMLPDVVSTLFRLSVGQASASVPEVTTPVVDVTPPAAVSSPSTVTVRRTRKSTEKAVIDLHGSLGSDLKLTVTIAKTPVSWSSAAAFQSDFQPGHGILYRYPRPAKPAFSARGAYAAIDVLFFDRNGRFLSGETMSRCTDKRCMRVQPESPIMYALEVQQGFIAKNKVNSLWRLSLDWMSKSDEALSLKETDRMSGRTRRQSQSVYIPTPSVVALDDSYIHLKILGELTAQKIRSSDMTASVAAEPDQAAIKRLWDVLTATVQANKGIRYAYLILPTQQKDAFTLAMDNFTYANEKQLDVNKNGKVDTDEAPAAIGTIYSHPSFTQALRTPTFDGRLGGGDVAYYIPIKDPYGVPVGVLAVVESVSR